MLHHRPGGQAVKSRMIKSKKPVGLPPGVLFRNCAVPAQRVPIKFLEEHVWWWRHELSFFAMWVGDACTEVGWISAFDQARAWTCFNEDRDLKDNFDAWCCGEIDAAQAYEWEARCIGQYPCNLPYNLLNRNQRKEWKRYYRLNLNAVPAVATDEDGEPTVDPEKWTTKARFNLRHGDKHLMKEFRRLLRIERQRLTIPNPKSLGSDRKPLKRSWAGIEGVDIGLYSRDVGKTSKHREHQRVMRELQPPTEVASWKLTVPPSTEINPS